MDTQNVWETDSRAIPAPLGNGCFWLDDAYTYEPLPLENAVNDTHFAPHSWVEAELEELQRTDFVPTTISGPGVPSPKFALPSSVDGYAGQGGIVTQRQDPYISTMETKHERGTTPSIFPDREGRQDDDIQRLMCLECGLDFENLQGLDRHAKSSLHKAWRCQEDGCGKTYARRDTFLRHRIKHTDSFHTCNVCSRSNKNKVFKRKDHLKEHMRNCHSRSVDRTRFVVQHACLQSGLTPE